MMKFIGIFGLLMITVSTVKPLDFSALSQKKPASGEICLDASQEVAEGQKHYRKIYQKKQAYLASLKQSGASMQRQLVYLDQKGNTVRYKIYLLKEGKKLYDGLVYYYPKDGGYVIETVGVKRGYGANGFYEPGLGYLYTPQCGKKKRLSSIRQAMRAVVHCAYTVHY